MAIKRILFPVHDRDDLSPVADWVFHLAQRFGARVTGIFPQAGAASAAAIGGEPTAAFAIRDLLAYAEKRAKQAAEEAKSAFGTLRARFPDVTAEFVAPGAPVADLTARGAFQADLTVIGTRAHYDGDYWWEVREGALVLSGRPVFIAPSKPVPGNLGERLIIAWKEGAEASRAVSAAMPFIEQAREVWLVTVGGADEAYRNAEQMRKYLELHGPEVTVDLLRRDGGSVAELLIGKTAETEGAILVMGAYSHWRWRERVFGGVTEHVLRDADVPVLMAH